MSIKERKKKKFISSYETRSTIFHTTINFKRFNKTNKKTLNKRKLQSYNGFEYKRRAITISAFKISTL